MPMTARKQEWMAALKVGFSELVAIDQPYLEVVAERAMARADFEMAPYIDQAIRLREEITRLREQLFGQRVVQIARRSGKKYLRSVAKAHVIARRRIQRIADGLADDHRIFLEQALYELDQAFEVFEPWDTSNLEGAIEQEPYESSPIFSSIEWDKVHEAAKARGLHWKELVRRATLEEVDHPRGTTAFVDDQDD